MNVYSSRKLSDSEHFQKFVETIASKFNPEDQNRPSSYRILFQEFTTPSPSSARKRSSYQVPPSPPRRKELQENTPPDNRTLNSSHKTNTSYRTLLWSPRRAIREVPVDPALAIKLHASMTKEIPPPFSKTIQIDPRISAPMEAYVQACSALIDAVIKTKPQTPQKDLEPVCEAMKENLICVKKLALIHIPVASIALKKRK